MPIGTGVYLAYNGKIIGYSQYICTAHLKPYWGYQFPQKDFLPFVNLKLSIFYPICYIQLNGCERYEIFLDFQRFLNRKSVERPDKDKLVSKPQAVMFTPALQDALNIIGRKWRL